MPRINAVTTENAPSEIQLIYNHISGKMGMVPNIFLNIGNSPVVLKAYMYLNDAISQTSIAPKLREQIALIVGQTNHCNYCLSAHTAIAKGLGLPEQEIMKARHGQSEDAKSQAILKFAKLVIDKRGQVSDQEVSNLKAAGVSDKEITEIVLIITVNIFTNYFNLITDPKIDFPHAPELN